VGALARRHKVTKGAGEKDVAVTQPKLRRVGGRERECDGVGLQRDHHQRRRGLGVGPRHGVQQGEADGPVENTSQMKDKK
jgi:hypothetical protein